MNAIQRALLLKEELDSLRPISRENEMRIMQKFRLDWNYHSNNLEGNSLTYGETKALILFGLTAQGKPFKDHLEMTGHNEAVEWIEEIVKEERPLTQAFIRELHTLLLKEPYQVDAITTIGEPTKKWIIVGNYKQTPNHVKTKTGEIFRFATVEETPAKMTDLIDWFQSEKEKGDYSAITTAIEFHYRFIRIHPFDDGNGRTARILMNFILMQSGYPPVIIKTNEKQQYIAALEQADAGLFEPFINYIADNLCKSLELIIRGAKGESVEEDNDIDKEIAMLDNRFRNIGRKVEIVKSEEILLEFSESAFKRILKCYVNSTLSFRKFFQKFDVFVHYLSPVNSPNVFISTDDFAEKIAKAFKRKTDIQETAVIITLGELKYVNLENESILIKLILRFENSKISISVEDTSYKLDFLYNDSFDDRKCFNLDDHIKKYVLQKMNSIIENH